jgi:hypothetical protein
MVEFYSIETQASFSTARLIFWSLPDLQIISLVEVPFFLEPVVAVLSVSACLIGEGYDGRCLPVVVRRIAQAYMVRDGTGFMHVSSFYNVSGSGKVIGALCTCIALFMELLSRSSLAQ